MQWCSYLGVQAPYAQPRIPQEWEAPSLCCHTLAENVVIAIGDHKTYITPSVCITGSVGSPLQIDLTCG